jgi:uncharacterized protein
MIIDCHVHLLTAKGYVEKLISEMDRLGIDKICLLAGKNYMRFWGSRMASNGQVIEAYRKYPDRIIPMAFLELGVDPPAMIDSLYAEGFRAFGEISKTRLNYNDDACMEYYARAAAYNMPMLMHTGTVFRIEEDQYYDVDSSRMRPIYLDRPARKFPNLKIIAAHLGNPWYEEAAMTLFWNPNIYFDLSGSILKRKDAAWFNETLWWTPERMKQMARSKDTHYKSALDHPFSRICFGSDVPIEEMEQVVDEYRSIMNDLKLPQELQERVMGKNAQEIFNVQDQP